MKNTYHQYEIMLLRISNIFAIIIFSSICIGSIVYMFTKGDIISYLIVLVIALSSMIAFTYFSEFYFIRTSTLKEVNIKNDNITFKYRSGRVLNIPKKSIIQHKSKGAVDYYYTNLNVEFNRFHKKGVFSSTMFDDNINNSILEVID